MCKVHKPTSAPVINERRRFLCLAATGAGALMLAGVLPNQVAYATGVAASLPKPQNAISPDDALTRLMDGNARYADGVTKRHDFMSERDALASGQNPFAAVLGCADSRIAPEYAFDTSRGDLFAVRVAGNFVTTDGLASLEYAVAVLGTPLIVVLGHDSCGAVSAGVKALKDDARFPGHIQSLADAIKPSVAKVLTQPGELLDNAIVQNVKDTVARLQRESSLLSSAMAKGTLNIVGGVYKLHTGKVERVV
ncbi:carbonic anhydrase [Pseudomonas sp. ADAK18]|uniref:carbonic anhydrase n=1 Tax=Pseudomonas sp. ADAK18 TaxID=2730848 RepID=UPI001463702D|nr:carbonic anhydrase [Pseudomonas sp. ADAK18]QJI28522.1 carbonic anhydrase [Pseudomonas sp. ADAK18]